MAAKRKVKARRKVKKPQRKTAARPTLTKGVRGGSTVIPGLRYRDAPAAIEFLCRAFGFKKHLVVPGPDNTIMHAQLTLGAGMVMLGSVARDSEWGTLIRQPDDIGLAETQAPYLVVANIDAHYRRAQAAGATIVFPLEQQEYGGKLYTCRDPEGHLWSIGSFDPWKE